MKTIILPFALLLLFSCKQPENIPDTPEALQEKSYTDIGLSKGRYQADLVESLYAELVDKSRELEELETAISKLDELRSDSLEDFHLFDQKNISYYHSAGQRVQQIKDSLLRQKINALIDNSLQGYNNRTARHKTLVDLLNSREAKLQDMHIVLKLVKTLPMIEGYQQQHIPSTRSIEQVIRLFDKTIQKTDSLTN